MKSVVYRFVTVMILVGLLSACAQAPSASSDPQAKQAKAPFKIGINNSLTGGFSVYALDYQKSYELLAKKVNAEGGINGHPLELVVRDSESDQVKSTNNVRSLATAGVHAIIGSPDFGLAIADVKVAEEAKVPYMIATPIDPPYSAGGYAFGWVGPTIDDTNKAQLLALKELGVRRFALLSPKDPVGEGNLAIYQRIAPELGFELVGNEFMLLTDTDVTPQLTKLRQSNPDVIQNDGSGKAAVVQFKSLKRLGWKVPMIALGANATPSFIEAVAEEKDIAFVWTDVIGLKPDTIPSNAPTRDMIIETAKYWEKEGAAFGSIGAWGWDQLRSVVAVMKDLNIDPATQDVQSVRDKIRSAMENQSFRGMSAEIKRTPNNHKGSGLPIMVVAKIEGKFFVPATKADLDNVRK